MQGCIEEGEGDKITPPLFSASAVLLTEVEEEEEGDKMTPHSSPACFIVYAGPVTMGGGRSAFFARKADPLTFSPVRPQGYCNSRNQWKRETERQRRGNFFSSKHTLALELWMSW